MRVQAPRRPAPFRLPAPAVVGGNGTGKAYLPEDWRVTPSGAFTYSIPLDVPAGRAGMQPSLSLDYSSGGGNGIAGMGWSVSGFSRITRCGQTLSTEGATRGVHYASYTGAPEAERDRFCLDGQKLLAVGGVDHGSGRYGEIDTQYRTEEDTFAQIISTGSGATEALGPERFLVRTKDGQVRTYTAQAVERTASAVTTDGQGLPDTRRRVVAEVPALWLLTEEQDRAGNTITYSYLPADPARLDVAPARIDYTSNRAGDGDARIAHRSVRFEYGGPDGSQAHRQDVERGWGAGVESQQSHLLARIVMAGPDESGAVTDQWHYDLTYHVSDSSGRMLLRAVRKVGALGAESWAKRFEWDEAQPQFTARSLDASMQLRRDTNLPYSEFSSPEMQIGNTVVSAPCSGCPANLLYGVVLRAGQQARPLAPAARLEVADLNGDGADDLQWTAGEGQPAHLRWSARDGADVTALATAGTAGGPTMLAPLDLDGDGHAELYDQTRVIQYDAANVAHQLPDLPVKAISFGDFDGDGLLDLVSKDGPPLLFAPDILTARIRFGIGDGRFGPPVDTGVPALHDFSGQITDLDGDGRAEVVAGHPIDDGVEFTAVGIDADGANQMRVSRVPGDPYQAFVGALEDYDRLPGDFNGDGLEDVALLSARWDGTDWKLPDLIVWNTGNGSQAEYLPRVDRDRFRDVRVGDVDGDGKDDLVSFWSEGLHLEQVTFSDLADQPACWCPSSAPPHEIEPVSGHPPPGAHCASKAWFDAHQPGAPQIFGASRFEGCGPDDGYTDAWVGVWYDATAQDHVTIARATAAGGFQRATLDVPRQYAGIRNGHSLSQLGDFDGDGRLDFVIATGQRSTGQPWDLSDPSYQAPTDSYQLRLYQQTATNPDLLVRVLDEPTAPRWPRLEVDYGRDWRSDSRLGTAEEPTCAYPLVCLRSGFPLVREVRSRAHAVDGPGIARVLDYSYDDPVADQLGRGFLGFAAFRVWDPQRPSETVTTYDHRRVATDRFLHARAFPGAFRPAEVLTVVPILDQVAGHPASARARITRTTQRYQRTDLGHGTFAIFPVERVASEFEDTVDLVGGAGVRAGIYGPRHVLDLDLPVPAERESTTTAEYDDLGNRTWTLTETAGGTRTETTTSYENRVDDWLIGLVQREAVDQVVGGASAHRTIELTHDALGRVASITRQPDGAPEEQRTETLAYDDLGNLVAMTSSAPDVAARTTHVEWAPAVGAWPDEAVYPSAVWADHDDARFRPASWFAVHPSLGAVLATVDVNGARATRQYDGLGRARREETDGAPPVDYTYLARPDAAGGTNGTELRATTQVSLGSPQQAKVFLDALGRPIRSQTMGFDGAWIETSARYDLLDRIAEITQPVAAGIRVTTSTFDSLDRPRVTTRPDGSHVEAVYPDLFQTIVTDPSGFVSQSVEDADGRVVRTANQQTGGAMIETSYVHGPFGTLVDVIAPGSQVTHADYDAVGRRIKLTRPDAGITNDRYDGLDQLVSEEHEGENRDLHYDDLGRLIYLRDKDGATSYEWDTSPGGIGAIARADGPDGFATSYRYDAIGRLLGEDLTEPGGTVFATDLTYDADGRPATLTYPEVSGRRYTLTYAYNGNQHLSHIFGSTPTGGSSLLWRVDRRNEDLALVDGVFGADVARVHRDHDPLTGRVTLMTAQRTGAIGPSTSLAYTYYANGLVRTRTDHVMDRVERFEYDPLRRLTRAELVSPAAIHDRHYRYDDTGNLTSMADNGTVVMRNDYDVLPHAASTHWELATGTEHLAYDAQGRQTSGGPRALVDYTAFDLPRQIVSAAGDKTTFAYDAFGQRVQKTSDAGTTLYVGDLYERRTTDGDVSHVFHVAGTDGPVAEITWNDDATLRSTRYLVGDALGTTTATLDGLGRIDERFYFDPFGARTDVDGGPAVSTSPLTLGFTGQEHDDELRLINFRGRMYDAHLGRFLTADPLVGAPGFGQAWNPYSYVMNSPLNLTDPSGYLPCDGPCPVEQKGGEGEVPPYTTDQSSVGDPTGQYVNPFDDDLDGPGSTSGSTTSSSGGTAHCVEGCGGSLGGAAQDTWTSGAGPHGGHGSGRASTSFSSQNRLGTYLPANKDGSGGYRSQRSSNWHLYLAGPGADGDKPAASSSPTEALEHANKALAATISNIEAIDRIIARQSRRTSAGEAARLRLRAKIIRLEARASLEHAKNSLDTALRLATFWFGENKRRLVAYDKADRGFVRRTFKGWGEFVDAREQYHRSIHYLNLSIEAVVAGTNFSDSASQFARTTEFLASIYEAQAEMYDADVDALRDK